MTQKMDEDQWLVVMVKDGESEHCTERDCS